MLISKRAIPRIATTGLVLGGAACDTTYHATPSNVAFEFCDTLFFQCYYADSGYALGGYTVYDYDYASVAQCDSIVGDYYAAYASDLNFYYGVDCGDAFLDYYECFWDAYGDYGCDAYAASDACAGFRHDVAVFCGF